MGNDRPVFTRAQGVGDTKGLLLTATSKNALQTGNHVSCMLLCKTQELHRTLHWTSRMVNMYEQENFNKAAEKRSVHLWTEYQPKLSHQCKKVPLTYGTFTFRTPKSFRFISQHLKWLPHMQNKSESQQLCCGRGLFLLTQAVNDCLKHKALERQARNDNELSTKHIKCYGDPIALN